MEAWVVATGLIVLYLVLTIVLGIVANRRMTGDMEDFLLYGRKAGFVVLYLTVVASFHSSFAFLGSGGFFYTHGVGFWVCPQWTVAWTPISDSACLLRICRWLTSAIDAKASPRKPIVCTRNRSSSVTILLVA